MCDVVTEKGIAPDFEVATKVPCADSVVVNAGSGEAAKIAIGVFQVIGTDCADDIHEAELLQRGKGIELSHALVAKSNLQ